MNQKAGDGGQSGSSEGGGTGDSIQIGDKVYTAEQLSQSIEKIGNLEKTLEGLSGFQKLLTTYGIGAEEYLRNSEAAFAIANNLLDQGIIDKEGNVITKKQDPPGDGDRDKKFQFGGGGDTELTKQVKAIASAMEKITGKVDELDKGQTNIYRTQIERDLKDVHKNLDRSDISQILATAQRDRSKSLWDHAAEFASNKETKDSQAKNSMAKEIITTLAEIGLIDKEKFDPAKLEKFDLNSLKEQGAGGGTPTYEGKRFMFSSRIKKLGRNADNAVSPAEASHEFLSKR